MRIKKEDLLQSCRYYKGEEECPYSDYNTSFLWSTELEWVTNNLKEKEEASSMDVEILRTYINAGLSDFNDKDKVPITLKALIFFRIKKYSYTANGFKDFYNKEYLKKGA